MFKLMGWGGSVQRLTVKTEYQNTINAIIDDYNKNFETPVLSYCTIEWITDENPLKEDETTIWLNFDDKDRPLNFYNAILSFVQKNLIPKAKAYLDTPYAEAIDLLTTHIILRYNRREALTTFLNKLDEFDTETKKELKSLMPTNDKGLFMNLLLPELHFYGELIATLPPSVAHHVEANGFFCWFKNLATREFDEKTNLKYTSKNLRVGVILIGKDETWETYGVDAYTKWADYYAMENYHSVYILAKGISRSDRATAVAKVLTMSKVFDQVNKNTYTKYYSSNGHEYVITYYALRPNKTNEAAMIWKRLKNYYTNGNVVPAIIANVQKDTVFVNVFGLRLKLSNNELSDMEITDARKLFKNEDELYLSITAFDIDAQLIVLTNKGTKSDPKHAIDAAINKVYNCCIEKILVDKQGIQIGLKVSSFGLKNWIYIPKARATFSRFLDLNDRFPVGTGVRAVIETYNSLTSYFEGYVEGLTNPRDSDAFKKLHVNDILEITVQQIHEFWVVCEIEEGLECGLARYEISWEQNECHTSKFKVGDFIKVCIVSIEADTRRIEVSIKRLSKTREHDFFEANYYKTVEVEIKIRLEVGLVVKYAEDTKMGFIHWSEMGYAPGRLDYAYKVGDKVKAVVFDFDLEKNNVRFSIRKQFIHQFKDWLSTVNIDEPVVGKIIAHSGGYAHVELVHEQHTVQALITKKKTSRLVSIDNEDLPYFLPIGGVFHFMIWQINEDKEIISLTRKDYLKTQVCPDYGVTANVKCVKERDSKMFFYSDNLEGWINLDRRSNTDPAPKKKPSAKTLKSRIDLNTLNDLSSLATQIPTPPRLTSKNIQVGSSINVILSCPYTKEFFPISHNE